MFMRLWKDCHQEKSPPLSGPTHKSKSKSTRPVETFKFSTTINVWQELIARSILREAKDNVSTETVTQI